MLTCFFSLCSTAKNTASHGLNSWPSRSRCLTSVSSLALQSSSAQANVLSFFPAVLPLLSRLSPPRSLSHRPSATVLVRSPQPTTATSSTSPKRVIFSTTALSQLPVCWATAKLELASSTRPRASTLMKRPTLTGAGSRSTEAIGIKGLFKLVLVSRLLAPAR